MAREAAVEPGRFPTILDSLLAHAHTNPQRTVYSYVSVAGQERLTYEELLVLVAAESRRLIDLGSRGERVLVVGEPGLEFPIHLLAAMLAGLIPVPIPPPYRDIDLDRLLAIARDSGCRTIVMGSRRKDALAKRIERRGMAREFRIVAVPRETLRLRREDAAGLFREGRINGHAPALLQYTSGSTGRPRGVLLTHGNIIANQRMIARAFGHSSDTVVAGWLPAYHDMGLIGLVMQPLFLGCECILMSPAEFVKNPFKWLQVISECRATTSGGPNFAYDLCAKLVDESRLEGLDLSCWRVAFNGSEKVRESTMDRFGRKFSRCGFRREAMFPCYGLAEASLFVSGGPAGRRPVVAQLDRSLLQSGWVTAYEGGTDGAVASVVSCGCPAEETTVLIIDPDNMEELDPGLVGEVWIRSPSVANGYWRDAEGTQEQFKAFTKNGEGPFLRSGDLGFLREGELYITGRLKDTIVLRGRNIFPEDVEAAALESSRFFGITSCVAFSVDAQNRERLVIVAEMRKRDQGDLAGTGVVEALRRSVAEGQGVSVEVIAFIEEGKIPRTTSGKVRRHAYKQMFVREELYVAWETDGETACRHV